MLAHCHGNIWNAAKFAPSLGMSQPTMRSYLDALTDLFIGRQLSPWHEHLKKRQVKLRKGYVRDSGLLHQLLSIVTEKNLMSHPKMGASWDGCAVEEVLRVVEPSAMQFWATHTGLNWIYLSPTRGGGSASRSSATMRLG